MKKKQHWLSSLIVCSLTLFLTGCTTLDYIGDDLETTKSSRIQTNEMFSLTTYQKTIDEQLVDIGVSQTTLENALVLYIGIQNNSDVVYKFDTNDIIVKSPIGDVSFITPGAYIEAYQSYEAMNYANMASSGAMLNSFTTMHNQYKHTVANSQRIENQNQNADILNIERTISGIQQHATTTFKYVEPNSKEYFYIFLRKPEEYPLTVQYKTLNYVFGNKKDEKE